MNTEARISQIMDAHEAAIEAQLALTATAQKRNILVKEALESGLPATEIAASLQLNRSRIYQMATQIREVKTETPKAPAVTFIDGQTSIEELDGSPRTTEGKLVDYSGTPSEKCPYCEMPTHFNQSKKKFWFYPKCTPTIRDHAKYSN